MKSRGFLLRSAFSITELVVTIAIIGVIAGIAIPMYNNAVETSRRTTAVDHIEALNRAVTNFSQGCWKFPTAANGSGTDDEYAVLRSLQWRFPASELKLGSPYFDPKYSPGVSSNANDLRIRWNGRTFELLDKGQSGTGFKFNAGNDYQTTPYSFPTGYRPEGA